MRAQTRKDARESSATRACALCAHVRVSRGKAAYDAKYEMAVDAVPVLMVYTL